MYFFSEELIRLSDFICYCPPEVEVELKPPPVITNRFITFGCFNNLAKLNHTVISTWSDILNAVPDSKIRLVTKGFKDITMQARYLKLFEGFGVKKNRVEFVITTLDRAAYLSQYNFIDIAFFNRVVESPATPPPGLSHMSATKIGFLYLFESNLASVRDECAE